MWRGVATTTAVLLALSGAARAGTDGGLRIRGTVTGVLERGSEVTLRTTASHPEGWQSLNEVTIDLELHDAVLETITYDISNQTLRAGSGSVLAGTGNTATGSFFRVRGLGLRVTTGGTDLTMSFRATLVERVPPEARFRFSAQDHEGEEASTARAAVVEEQERGLSLATAILAVIGALLVGGFVGGQVTASRRRRPSVYASLAGRIERERAGRGGGRT